MIRTAEIIGYSRKRFNVLVPARTRLVAGAANHRQAALTPTALAAAQGYDPPASKAHSNKGID